MQPCKRKIKDAENQNLAKERGRKNPQGNNEKMLQEKSRATSLENNQSRKNRAHGAPGRNGPKKNKKQKIPEVLVYDERSYTDL